MMVCAPSPTVAILRWIPCEIPGSLQYNGVLVKLSVGKKCALSTTWVEQLEIRQLFAFANWSAIGPAIALVPQSAGQLTSVSVVNFSTTVYTGPLNVTNTLNRIRADGTPDRTDDGIVYTNPQASGLPVDGTYYEFTVEPSGGTDQNFSSSISFPGPMRILLATGGDCYFTGDHYSTFEPVYIPGTTTSAPTIGSFTVSPATVTAGTSVTLTASNVTETGGTISSVNFYLESNGTAGLQTATDTFISLGVHSGTTWLVSTSTAGMAAGSYTYYAVATDTTNISSTSSATLTVSSPVTGNTLAAWDVNGQTNFGTQGLSATSVATGVSNSLGLTRGSGVTTSGSGAANAWGGAGWSTSTTSSAAGITANSFVTFGLTVSADSTASLSAIDMNYRHSSTGPTDGDWQYQLNSGSWNEIGNFSDEFPNAGPSPMTEINLAGFNALQNLAGGTVVNFRVVPYGATGSTGTWYVGDETGNDLTIKGAVVSGGPLSLTGPANYLKLDADGQHVDIWNSTSDSGTASQSILLSQISLMNVTGSAANDSLTIDFSAGDPLILGGLSFDGGTGGQNNLNIIGTSGSDSLSVGSSTILFGSVPISYTDTTAITFSGGAGTDVLTQTAQPGGGATLAFTGTTAADTLTVNAGTFTFPAPTNAGITPLLLGTMSIKTGASVALAAPSAPANRTVLVLNTLTIAINGPNWLGQLDLSGNDMIVQSGTLATVTGQITSGYNGGNWIGKGIISSAAANDPTNLTTLGVLASTSAGTFDGQSTAAGNVLVKYTYFGDANLDGRVDGDDYSEIDNGFNTNLTGWSNGDFDYSNSVNASDYLLIDNTFNTGPANLAVASKVATPLAINSFSNTPSPEFVNFDIDDLRGKSRWTIL
jgi:guanyl-specific ribonuclease Sa